MVPPQPLTLSAAYAYRPTLQWAGTCPPTTLPSPRGSGPLPNTWFLDPTRIRIPQPKRHLGRFSRFCRARSRVQQTHRQTTLHLQLQAASLYSVHACAAYNFFGLEE